jgi:hypothetical protein
MHDESEHVDPLPRVLAEASEDDEPLTPEEAAMLDARLSTLASGTAPTFSHEEVGRLLRKLR